MKRYRIWFKNPRFNYEIGVGNTKKEALEYARKMKRIGRKKIKSITLASR